MDQTETQAKGDATDTVDKSDLKWSYVTTVFANTRRKPDSGNSGKRENDGHNLIKPPV